MLGWVEAEHVRIRCVLRKPGSCACNKISFVDDEVVNSDEARSCSVEIVHRNHVLVIIGPSHGLVRQVVRVRQCVQVESTGWIIARRDRDQDLVRVNVDNRREPSSTTIVIAYLRIRKRSSRDPEETVEPKSRSD